MKREFIRIVEVGVRDGLQNESKFVPTSVKLELIYKLQQSGLKTIESTSFVSPKWIPQMSDSKQLLQSLNTDKRFNPSISFPVLTPNLKGAIDAIDSGAKEISVFTASTEEFNLKNINCSISESFDRFIPIFKLAKEKDIKVRGYVSCVLGCPYKGNVLHSDVVKIAKRLYEMGCYEISLGDTIGVGTPNAMNDLIVALSKQLPLSTIAVHCHDTYGQALANIYAAIKLGVRTVDSSVSGLGGCPYAKGATGNVATEDVVYMLHGMGFDTGIDMGLLLEASKFISNHLNRQIGSKAGLALLSKM